MPISLLNKIIYGARRIAFQFKEKPEAKIDDYALEHMVFYHGLAGTSPKSDKEVRQLRADIKEALTNKSRIGLCLALKLPPTIWEEQLKDIISKLTADEQQLLVELLLPEEIDKSWTIEAGSNSIAIAHTDWRVQANAANILAFLHAKQAATALATCLSSDTTGSIMSFCYIAYALGKLQGQAAKEALAKQLGNTDPWLRVDAAGALAYFDFAQTANLLAKALLAEEESLDYMAYAISRHHKPAKFLKSAEAEIIKGGGQLISGLIEAAENSFGPDLIIETEANLCLPLLMELIEQKPDVVLIDAAWDLGNGRMQCAPTVPSGVASSLPQGQPSSARVTEIANKANVREAILNSLDQAVAGKQIQTSADFIHAVKLIGKLKLVETQSKLSRLLVEAKAQLSNAQINCLIASLGELGDNQACSVLIGFARELLNIEERSQITKSKQPVWEENSAKAKTYWQILKALGNLPGEESVSFLFQALDDYAPDQRACALGSLITVHKTNPQLKLPESIENILRKALKDPSPMVQLVALKSAVLFPETNLIEEILPLIDAQENTLSKQALASLDELAKAGKLAEIAPPLREKLKSMKEEHKKIRILDILQK